MARYLLEVEHDKEERACLKAVEVFLTSGSHFLTNADFGCEDGEHKAWIIADAENKDEARFLLPPAFRRIAKIVKLSKFTLEQIDTLKQMHAMG